MNLPNYITFFRILIIPFLILVFYLPENFLGGLSRNLLATFFFILAGISDWLDGYLARRMGLESKFGAFIDPVADKLIVISSLVMLVELDRVSAIIAVIIIGREVAVSSLREWMAGIGSSNSVAVVFIGKLKTTLQFIAIGLLLYFEDIFFIPIFFLGQITIWAAAFLTIISMLYYLKQAFTVK
ncbi:MAG: CDP-diacylglycerol--glycerol-3-phosphate 3-phosphatidyltransferase [Proteobacteria bacterium]|jgi:CDP-diacylglycerol--glycerol-3-phosphate 3-phosphatidyltransferase|nr:CDP-diacylglycerol--glycerol-3-phosphate 3-phosphatidyltransferase [Pseudomonadota bacterium]MDA0941232.1 CDP-diacylglycerol--glycerol-3-phosphate 3-phosphatidyltransferase [Pseudomonadota bacterium]MDA1034033.1 CDP-diacylglycerol--glycerol-3-phosphate 3-phosphatidyltransferase [Pseudomonadota bacterium]